jgi:CDP-glycerol glycerophosphotransferase (TagB/SpsB family)
MKNIIYLDSMFDVNVLLKYVDIIISDYSSAAFDAIYLKKPVIMYVPDLDDYERGNNGLLFNMREYCAPLLVFGIDDLIKTIKTVKEGEYFSQERINTLNRMRRDFFGEKEHNYKSIWEDIRNASRK